jgi:hypothetical protein
MKKKIADGAIDRTAGLEKSLLSRKPPVVAFGEWLPNREMTTVL